MTNLFEILRTLLIKLIFCSVVTEREKKREEREKIRKERRPRKEEIRNKGRKEK